MARTDQRWEALKSLFTNLPLTNPTSFAPDFWFNIPIGAERKRMKSSEGINKLRINIFLEFFRPSPPNLVNSVTMRSYPHVG